LLQRSPSYGHDQYRRLHLETRLAGADPMTLVSILYDELLISVGVLQVLTKRGEAVLNSHQAQRAHSILTSLEVSLDMDAPGGLGASLASLYRSMRKQLNSALIARDETLLKSLHEGIQTVADAWQQIK
jgi:flagellar secretion chaperone FliS